MLPGNQGEIGFRRIFGLAKARIWNLAKALFYSMTMG
tara:strand:- start:25742 stop:25852 length:111 start_codon:yes stop_codon:yes gene_type:complete